MDKPKISILLAAYKGENLLNKIFTSSWCKNTTVETELIIYDNGENGNALLPWKVRPSACGAAPGEVKVIGDGRNIGLNNALNATAKCAKGDWFYLPHLDMYMLPRWDLSLLEAVKNQPPDKILLCSRSIEPTKGHTDFHIIKNYGMEWDEFEEEKLLDDYKDYKDHSILSGYRMPFFLSRGLWTKMGGVDAEYFSYCTDDDLVQEAYDAGVRKFWMVYNSLVYHLQGKSNQQQTVDRDSNRPYEYFVAKWKERGYSDAGHPAHWHPKLIPWYQKIR